MNRKPEPISAIHSRSEGTAGGRAPVVAQAPVPFASASLGLGALAERKEADWPEHARIPSWRYVEHLEYKVTLGEVLLFTPNERGDGWEAIGGDAEIIARDLGIGMTYVQCEGRTLAIAAVPAVFIDAAIRRLRGLGRAVAVAAVCNDEHGAGRATAIVRRYRTDAPRPDPPELRIREALKALPTSVRCIADAILKRGSNWEQRLVARPIRQWLVRLEAEKEDGISRDGWPKRWQTALPHPEILEELAGCVAEWSVDDQKKILAHLRAWRDRTDEILQEPLESESDAADGADGETEE